MLALVPTERRAGRGARLHSLFADRTARGGGMNLPMNSHARAPSHRKPAMPRASEIAARLEAGESMASIAAGCGRAVDAVQAYLSTRGYDGTTALPLVAPGPQTTTPVRFNDQPWAVDALCAETDPEAFFPEQGASLREARAVCARCDVRAECLAWALDNDQRYGLWGGMSERDRRKMRRDAS